MVIISAPLQMKVFHSHNRIGNKTKMLPPPARITENSNIEVLIWLLLTTFYKRRLSDISVDYRLFLMNSNFQSCPFPGGIMEVCTLILHQANSIRVVGAIVNDRQLLAYKIVYTDVISSFNQPLAQCLQL